MRRFALFFFVVGCAPGSVGSELALASGAVAARFSEGGAVISTERAEALLRVSSLARGDAELALETDRRHVRSGDEVRVTLATGVVEWWRAAPLGLEHGVTIAERPPGEGPLVLEVETVGLAPHLRAEGVAELRAPSGAVAMTYGELVVLDAGGARIPSRMDVAGGRIVLRVDDADARYPLVVDPLVLAEEATLTPTTPRSNDNAGQGVSISADGSRAVVAAANATTIFLRSGTTWAVEATLRGARSAALSGDGTRALLGDSTGTDPTVFVRSGTTWTMERTFSASLTDAVALDADGTRAARVGDGVGAVEMYARSGTTWSQEGSFDFGTTSDPDAIAMSRDGATVVVGLPDDDPGGTTNGGRVRIYERTGSTWTVAATLAEGTPGSFRRIGSSVAISADGLRIVAGGPGQPGAGGTAGRAAVFVRGGSWTFEGALLAPDGSTNDALGTSVAISADGRIALVGAAGDEADRGSVRAFVRSGSTWSHDGAFLASDGVAGDALGTTISVSDAELRALVGAPDDGATDTGSARVLRIGGGPGWTCTLDAECGGGFCTDGVCCTARCDRACESCATNGTCTPSPSTTVCRASAGPCDPVAESCNGTSGACPADVRSPVGTTCRAATGACDVAETCDGSAACPADVRMPAATECRAASSPCDLPELCDGVAGACPVAGSSGVMPSGTSCRGSGGLCDVAEVCDGVTTTCPGDVLLPRDTPCGAVAGSCASPGRCTGSSPACMGSTPLPMGTVCLYASPANPCDLDDVCDGTSTSCPARFAAAGTICNDVVSGLCDTEDVCTGTSADCEPTFLAGTECRAASGECDSPEFCSGGGPLCPPDAVEAAGMACRTSVGSCDPAEVCDGLASSCPADVNDCVADAGTDTDAGAGAPDAGADAAIPPDAGSAVVATAGCGCRVAARRPAPLGLLALALLVLSTRARGGARARRRQRTDERASVRRGARPHQADIGPMSITRKPAALSSCAADALRAPLRQ